MPKSRLNYWTQKISRNRKRDKLTLRKLRQMRWKCLVVWECQMHNWDALRKRLVLFLEA